MACETQGCARAPSTFPRTHLQAHTHIHCFYTFPKNAFGPDDNYFQLGKPTKKGKKSLTTEEESLQHVFG